jgi:hypothetical protein
MGEPAPVRMSDVTTRFRAGFEELCAVDTELQDVRAEQLMLEVDPAFLSLRPVAQAAVRAGRHSRGALDAVLLEYVRSVLTATDVRDFPILREHHKAVELVSLAACMLSDEVKDLFPPLWAVSFLARSQTRLPSPGMPFLSGITDLDAGAILVELCTFILPPVRIHLGFVAGVAQTPEALKGDCRMVMYLGAAHQLHTAATIAVDDLSQFLGPYVQAAVIPDPDPAARAAETERQLVALREQVPALAGGHVGVSEMAKVRLLVIRCAIVVGEVFRSIREISTGFAAPSATVVAFAELRNKLCHYEYASFAAADGHRPHDRDVLDLAKCRALFATLCHARVLLEAMRVEFDHCRSCCQTLPEGAAADAIAGIPALGGETPAAVARRRIITQAAEGPFVPTNAGKTAHLLAIKNCVDPGQLRGVLNDAFKDRYAAFLETNYRTQFLAAAAGTSLPGGDEALRSVTDTCAALFPLDPSPFAVADHLREAVVTSTARGHLPKRLLEVQLALTGDAAPFSFRSKEVPVFPEGRVGLPYALAHFARPLVARDLAVLQVVVLWLHGLFLARRRAGRPVPGGLERHIAEVRQCRNIVSHGGSAALLHAMPRGSQEESFTWVRYVGLLNALLG